jgi:hypothetical protein
LGKFYTDDAQAQKQVMDFCKSTLNVESGKMSFGFAGALVLAILVFLYYFFNLRPKLLISKYF